MNRLRPDALKEFVFSIIFSALAAVCTEALEGVRSTEILNHSMLYA